MKKVIFALIVGAIAMLSFAFAQDDERSRFVRFVERQISTPDRQIRLGQIDGALSSDVRISQITIADREGVWLTINDARLVWSRLALVRGRLDIDLLEASSIDIARAPIPPEGESEPIDDTPFEVPELPVELLLDRLSVPQVDIGAGIIGPAARLSVDGSVALAGGALDTDLTIERLDEPGALRLVADFSNEDRTLSVDFNYQEPEGGVLANALNIEGRPDLSFSVIGAGPLDSFRADISLISAGSELLTGAFALQSPEGGTRFTLDLDGNLRPLVPALYAPFVDDGSRLSVDVTRRADGTVAISRGALQSGVADLRFAGELAADFVPVDLTVNGNLRAADGGRLPLPGGGGASTIGGANIDIALSSAAGTFNADIALNGLDTAALQAPSARIRANGTVADLANPATRAVTFSVDGEAEGLSSDNPSIADALGRTINLAASGSWMAGRPATIQNAQITAEALDASFAGRIGDSVIGTYTLNAGRLAAFSGLAGRDLSGSIALNARGTVSSGGLFDLSIDATTEALGLGSDALNGLLGGNTSMTGSLARQENRITFQSFRVDGQALNLSVDGTVSDSEANLFANLRLASLRGVDRRLDGAVDVRVSVTGNPDAPTLAARLESPAIVVNQEEIRSLQLAFDGTLDRESTVTADLDGRLSLNARVNNEPASLSVTLTSTEAGRLLDQLSLSLLGATADGRLAVNPDGLADGRLAFNVPDLAAVARLALLDASGTLGGTIGLSHEDGQQNADVNATARQLSVPGVDVGFAAIDLSIANALGVPTLDGSAEASGVKAAGFDVRSARLTATGAGADTDLSLSADLSSGQVATTGRLSRTEDGFVARLATLDVAQNDVRAALLGPTTVSVAGRDISISPAELSVGDGRVELEGTLSDTLNITAMLDRVPLSVANAIRPQLGLGGEVSGRLSATGARAAPDATFEVDASGVTAALLRERGIDPLTITASGRANDGTVTIQQLETSIAGGTLSAVGTVGAALDLNVRVDALPLALANATVPELDLSGTLSGRAEVTGTPSDPAADVEVTIDNASAAMLRRADLPTINAVLDATYAAGTADITQAVVRIGNGTVTARGSVGDRLDLTANLSQVPLALANAVQPDLAVAGDLNGSVKAVGSLTAPDISFDLNAPAITAAPLSRAGLPAAAFTARGTADQRGANLADARLTIGAASLTASGLVGQQLNLKVDANALPLAIANGFSPGLGLSGALSGRADVTGRAARPNARFSLAIPNLSASALDQAGVGALAVQADGAFEGNRVVLNSATAAGAGLSARASGVVPLSGGGLDLSVNATAPLSLADRFVAERGTRLGGEVSVDARVSGSLTQPLVSGSVRGSGLSARDPQTSLNLTGGTLVANLSGDRVVIETFRAAAGDGSVAVSGSVGISGDFPADLTVALRRLRLADGRLYVITVDADLRLTGPLTAGPLLAGRVVIDRAEISVPTQLSGSPSLIAVEHFNIPPQVLETLRRARAGPFADQERGARGRRSALLLDVTVDAPARVFIRGRGIDAELGGQIRLTGPVEDIVPVGRFELIRGRLSILGQRIDFNEGSLTFFGDLNPFIRLVAETRTSEVTVRIIVEGPANSPEIRIQSDPELPQDEALAQLLFGRSISDLSAFQLAQLAASVAELAGGGGGPSVLDQVRVLSGFDDIDIVSDPEGGTSVRAGRYIADNIYLGVVAGTESSGVAVNLDVTRNLKLRAETLTNESTFGVFFEREY